MAVKLDTPVHDLNDNDFIDTFDRLVHSIVRRRYGKSLNAIKYRTNLEYVDLIQIGKIGLIKARERFDPSRGFKFTTYAVPLIIGEISRFLRDSNKVKVSRSVVEVQNKIFKDDALAKTPKEIAELYGVNEKIAQAALEYRPNYCSLNQATYQNDDSKEIELQDMVEYEEETENLEETVANNDLVARFLSTLSEKERLVWYLYNKEDLGQRDVGVKAGISQVQVSRILKNIDLKAAQYGKRYGLRR